MIQCEIDPNIIPIPKGMSFKIKFKKNFFTNAFCSFLIINLTPCLIAFQPFFYQLNCQNSQQPPVSG